MTKRRTTQEFIEISQKTHQGFTERIKGMCDTIDLYDEIKTEMLKNHCSLNVILKIDEKIRNEVKEMHAIDNCQCDVKKGEGCSSPLCPSNYENLYQVIGK
jgi:hypothetical protein